MPANSFNGFTDFGVGIGLRIPHYRHIFERQPVVDWFTAMAEAIRTALDMPLAEGSVVYVPGPIRFTVSVAGAVDHPGDVQVNEGDRLSMVIAKAGNSQNAQADLNHIHLIRMGADGKQTTTEVNLYLVLKGGDPNADVAVEKGDVVYVPQGVRHSDIFSGIGSGLLYVLTHFIP